MSRRVVITGMGAITPIGNNVNDFWDSIKSGRHGFARISKFDPTGFKATIAAEVKDFDAKQYMDAKSARRMEEFCQYAVAAAGEAIADSGLDMSKEDLFEVGTAIGCGVGSLQVTEREVPKLNEKGPGKMGPLTIPQMISNMAAGNVAITYGLKGKSINVVTACATGTNSIGEAFRSIQYGEASVMLAGGTEAGVTPIAIGGFCALTALSPSEDPDTCCLPFDKRRSGFVMGEGSGVLVLEELEHARNRGARIYAEITGYGCSSDAYHITSPLEDGSGAAKAMEKAIKDAGLDVTDITYINAHGTSTHHNDLFETRAIKALFGSHAKNIRINSTKSMMGHLLGAAGAVELIACVKEIQDGYIHRTLGWAVEDEEMDLDYCPEPVEEQVKHALSNSLGFGGHNATLIVSRFEE